MSVVSLKVIVLLIVVALTGCSTVMQKSTDVTRLRQRSLQALKRGVRYEHLATVRAQSIEALQEVDDTDVRPWIRQALNDRTPAVRFAACMALGDLRDAVAEAALRRLASSSTPSDRIGSLYALHRLGDTTRSQALAEYLLNAPDPATRSNAAMVLGRLGEPGAIDLLAQAMRDPELSVRTNTLEALALLGSEEGRATLYAGAYSGIGVEETISITALASLRDPRYRKLFRHKLTNAGHLETKLAAARALGWLGDKSGLNTALDALDYEPAEDRKNDPIANQRLRIRQMAALALGAIGDRSALGPLEKMMNESDDPRLQVAAAKAIRDILSGA